MKKTGRIRRLTAFLLAAAILLGLTVPSRAEASVGAYHPVTEAPKTMPNIPVQGKLDEYNYLEDGYYAFLPVRYPVILNVEDRTENISYHEAYIPVVMFKGMVFASLEILDFITKITIETSANGEAIRMEQMGRRLFASAGTTRAKYLIYDGGCTELFDYASFNLSSAPFVLNEQTYVPLHEVLMLFGYDPYVQEVDKTPLYCLQRPYRKALDVMADLKVSYNDFIADYVLNGQDTRTAYISSGYLSVMEDVFDLEPEAVWMFIKGAFGMNGMDSWEKNMVEEVVDVMAGIGEDEADALTTVAKESLGPIWETILAVTDTAQQAEMSDAKALFETLLKTEDAGGEEMSKTLKKIAALGAEIDDGNLDALSKYIDKGSIGIDAAFDLLEIFQTYSAYDKRDKIAIDGLDLLAENGASAAVSYNDNERKALSNRVQALHQNSLLYSLKEYIWSNWLSLIAKGLKLDTFFSAYKLGALFIYGYEETMDSARAMQHAVYAIPLQENIAMRMLHRFATVSGEMTDQELQEAMAISYLFIKSCYVSKRLVYLAADHSSEAVQEWEKAREAYPLSEMGLLSSEYESADTLEELLGKSGKVPGDLIGLIKPLVTQAAGKVLKRSDRKTPVDDALCDVTADETMIGSFNPNADGKYVADIPYFIPDEKIYSLDFEVPTELELKFSSPTIEGTDTKKIEAVPFDQVQVPTAYLGLQSYYEYIRDELLPQTRYAVLAENSRYVTARDVWNHLGWDDRSGLLGADILDLNGDEVDDMLLYSIRRSTYGTKTDQLFVQLFTRDENGEIIAKNEILLVGMTAVNFQIFSGGIMELSGQYYFYTESNSNAYFADGNGLSFAWYTYDGDQLYMKYQMGKNYGGSDEIGYSYREYTSDGKFTETMLWADSGWQRYYGTVKNPENILKALQNGFASMGLTEPKLVTEETARFSISGGPYQFPTYLDTKQLQKSFAYRCTGTGSSYTAKTMKTTLADFTTLQKHIEELDQ